MREDTLSPLTINKNVLWFSPGSWVNGDAASLVCLDFSGPLPLVRSRGLAWPPLLASCCWWRRHHWHFWPFEYVRFSLSLKQKKNSICINHVFSQLIIPKIHVVMNYTFMQCLIISLRSPIGIRHLSLFLYFPWSLWGSIEKLTTVKKKINVHNDWIYFTFQRVFLWIHPLLRITTCTSQLSQILTKKQMYVINFNVMICNRYCM